MLRIGLAKEHKSIFGWLWSLIFRNKQLQSNTDNKDIKVVVVDMAKTPKSELVSSALEKPVDMPSPYPDIWKMFADMIVEIDEKTAKETAAQHAMLRDPEFHAFVKKALGIMIERAQGSYDYDFFMRHSFKELDGNFIPYCKLLVPFCKEIGISTRVDTDSLHFTVDDVKKALQTIKPTIEDDMRPLLSRGVYR